MADSWLEGLSEEGLEILSETIPRLFCRYSDFAAVYTVA